PSHKSWFAREYATQPFERLPPGCSQEVSCRPGTTRPADWWPPDPELPVGAWFPGRWRKAQRQSTDTERGCAPESRATHTTGGTSASPTPGFPRRLGGRKLANHRANHPIAGIGARWEDPTAS